ncbi:MAG TPA: DUF2177 family protein [Candidatus Limnocylindria bacterium]|jgi:uncharacterized membrane protein|nr:DUF2177 family protein [Candidatus Limnocylindria bacterium]
MSIPALLATFGVMAVLDGIWLTLVARNFYRDNIGHLLGDATNWPPAILFYVIYTVGAWFFATQAGVDDGSAITGALRGAAFGFVAYATYDLTNHATLRGWPTLVTVVDMAWGTVLTATVAGLATWITLTFFAS